MRRTPLAGGPVYLFCYGVPLGATAATCLTARAASAARGRLRETPAPSLPDVKRGGNV
jgi:hypothetical protein